MENTLDTSKLLIGEEIKNYKVLCQKLNLPVVAGKSKQLQFKECDRFFKYTKQGNKFIVTEIYDVPLEKIDDRANGNNSIYVTLIESLLLSILSEQKSQTLVCTKNYLLVALGITNKNYIDRNSRNMIAKIKSFKDYEMNEFNNRAYQTLNRILITSLKNLQRRCLIGYSEELHYTKISEDSGKSYEDVATEDEYRKYISLKREVLDEMGFKDLRDVYFSHKTDDFYETLRDKLYDEFLWDNSSIYYRIIFTKKDVVRYIPKVKEELDQKLELNDKIVTAINNNAQTRYDNMVAKFQKEYDELCIINKSDYVPSEIMKSYLPAINYVDRQKDIAEELIRIKDKKINKKVI